MTRNGFGVSVHTHAQLPVQQWWVQGEAWLWGGTGLRWGVALDAQTMADLFPLAAAGVWLGGQGISSQQQDSDFFPQGPRERGRTWEKLQRQLEAALNI